MSGVSYQQLQKPVSLRGPLNATAIIIITKARIFPTFYVNACKMHMSDLSVGAWHPIVLTTES